MFKSIQSFGIFILLTLTFSASAIAAPQSDPTADAILKASKEKFESLQDFSAKVTMTVSAPQYQNDIVNTGSLKMKKEKFLTTFSSIEVYCDGKTVWTLLTEEEEMIVSDYDPVESMGVDQIFQIYGDSVDSKYEGVVSGMDKVSLISHNSESNYGKVELWISKTTKLIVKATMIARNGSKYTYDFKNIETNLGIPDSEFVIDHNTKESEGWIVDDER